MNAIDMPLAERRQTERRTYEWEPQLFQGFPPIYPIDRRTVRQPLRLISHGAQAVSGFRWWMGASLIGALLVGTLAGSAAKTSRHPEVIFLVRQRVAPSQAIYQWNGFHRMAPTPMTRLETPFPNYR